MRSNHENVFPFQLFIITTESALKIHVLVDLRIPLSFGKLKQCLRNLVVRFVYLHQSKIPRKYDLNRCDANITKPKQRQSDDG